MKVLDDPTDHRYIRVLDMTPTGLDMSSVKFISHQAQQAIARYTITHQDVYISIAGTIGRVGIVPKELSGSNLTENAAKITDIDQNLDHRFLAAYLQSDDGQADIRARTVGTSQPKLALFRIEDIPVPLPPVEVQRRIVSVLAAYEELIKNNLRRIEILEEMAQAVYKEWFVEFRFPGYENVELLESELGPIPQGWEVSTLAAVAEVNALSIRKGSGPEFINYIDISSVTPRSVQEIRPMAFEDAPGRARRVVRDGDTIWSTVRPNRKSFALILDPAPDTVVSTGFAVLSPRDVPYTFLYESVGTDEFAGYLANHARGAAYPAVSGGDFEAALLAVPTEEVLDLYHEVAKPMLCLASTLRKQNEILRNTRDLLLPKLVSGEVDVSDLDIDTEWLVA